MRFNTRLTMRFKDAYAARHEPEAALSLSRFYWGVFLFIFVLLSILSITYGIWEFSRGTGASDSLGIRPPPIFTRTQLQTVLESFDQRGAEFEARLRAPAPAQDPS